MQKRERILEMMVFASSDIDGMEYMCSRVLFLRLMMNEGQKV